MPQPQGFWGTTLGMTLTLWLCTLPVVALIVLPLWGSRTALLAAMVLLVAMLFICWTLCNVRPLEEEEKQARRAKTRVKQAGLATCQRRTASRPWRGRQMERNGWNAIRRLFVATLLVASGASAAVWAAEDGGLTLHHQAAGLTVTLTTQPSPPRAGENRLHVNLTDKQGQPIPHAQVRLVITQALTMPGMHRERSREVQTTSTHVGVYEGRVHLATPGRWEVIVNVIQPGRPAMQALFYLNVEPT